MDSGYRIEEWLEDREPGAEELREVLEADGYMVFQWSDQPGSVYPPHSHGEEQSHCVVSGELELDVEGYGKVTLGPGDRDFMSAGTVHSAKVIGSEPVVYLIGRKV